MEYKYMGDDIDIRYYNMKDARTPVHVFSAQKLSHSPDALGKILRVIKKKVVTHHHRPSRVSRVALTKL